MDTTRRFIMAINFSVVTGTIIGLFWLIYWLITGNMPLCSEVWIIPHDWVISLPPEPRWLDWLLGPLFSFIFVWLFTSEMMEDYSISGEIDKALAVYLGLTLALAEGTVFIPAGGLITGMIISLVAAGLMTYGMGLIAGLSFVLGSSLGAGLEYGLVAGIGAGLVAGTFVGLSGAVFGVGLVTFTCLVFSVETWKTIIHTLSATCRAVWKWMMAKDQDDEMFWAAEEERFGNQ